MGKRPGSTAAALAARVPGRKGRTQKSARSCQRDDRTVEMTSLCRRADCKGLRVSASLKARPTRSQLTKTEYAIAARSPAAYNGHRPAAPARDCRRDARWSSGHDPADRYDAWRSAVRCTVMSLWPRTQWGAPEIVRHGVQVDPHSPIGLSFLALLRQRGTKDIAKQSLTPDDIERTRLGRRVELTPPG